MDDKKNFIPVNSYVRLKKGYDETDMYRKVEAGATGWVRDRKIDDYGFTMILIEWDETNPKYAGEIDKWVFENHFEVVSQKVEKADSPERYIENVRIATDAALAAEGFFLLTVHKGKLKNGKSFYEPAIYSGQLSREIAFILEAQITHMASTLFQEYVQDTLNASEMLNRLKEEEDESGR